MSKVKKDKKWYCDMDLKPSHWTRGPLGFGKVCNARVYPPQPCPNSRNHA
jgi:hypothetical protein